MVIVAVPIWFGAGVIVSERPSVPCWLTAILLVGISPGFDDENANLSVEVLMSSSVKEARTDVLMGVVSGGICPTRGGATNVALKSPKVRMLF